MLLGLTGCSGTGASTVARVWSGLGARVCSLDRIGHRLLQRRQVMAELAKELGHHQLEVMDVTSARAFLREMAFTDKAVLQGVNRVMHSRLRKWASLAAYALRLRRGVFVLDGALIHELELSRHADLTIAVRDTAERCLPRLCRRDGIPMETARGRWKSQMDIDEKCRRSHFVINNGGNCNELILTAENFYKSVIKKLEG